jgi:hypothetical protein
MENLPPLVATGRTHRSVRRYRLNRWLLAADVLLLVVISVAFWRSLDVLGGIWGQQFDFWMQKTGLPARIDDGASIEVGSWVRRIAVSAATLMPTATAWWGSALVCAGVWIGTMFMNRERLPLVYFLRLLVLVHASALFYFYLWPDRLPISVAAYLSDMFRQAMYVVVLLPLLFGLVLFPFALSVGVRYGAVLAGALFVVLATPLQVAFVACLLHMGSVLMLPVLFLFFGFLPLLIGLMGIYGFALSLLPPDAELIKRGVLIS